MIGSRSQLRGPQLYSENDAAALSGAALLAMRVLEEALELVRPGILPVDIAQLCSRRIRDHAASPIMADMTNAIGSRFGHACAISIDDVVAHARPTNQPLRHGQLVTVDLMLEIDGWHADVAESVVVGGGGHPLLDALDTVWRAGLEALQPGKAWSDVARAMDLAAQGVGVRLVQGLSGHGIGLVPHERPVLPLVPKRSDPPAVLHPGMVLTLEPAITSGVGEAEDSEDGWAISTCDGAPAVTRERMIFVESDGIRVLGLSGLDDSETAAGYNPLRTGPGSGV